MRTIGTIYQQNQQITCDFDYIYAQHTKNETRIKVARQDTLFDDGKVTASFKIKQKSGKEVNWVIPLDSMDYINLKDSILSHSGIASVSLFCETETGRITTNALRFDIVVSNSIEGTPPPVEDETWQDQVKDYIDESLKANYVIKEVDKQVDLPTFGDNKYIYFVKESMTSYLWSESSQSYFPIVPTLDEVKTIDGGEM